jgi:hypothetical protein
MSSVIFLTLRVLQDQFWGEEERVMLSEMVCPLCTNTKTVFHATGSYNPSYCCDICSLVFRKPSLTAKEEASRYKLHENNPEDPQYQDFLNRLFLPLNQRLEASGRGLDFGSGPGPAMQRLAEEAGHKMQNYDPFFAPEKCLLDNQYDFVTCTEVVEHFCNPQIEFKLFNQLLKPQAWLGIMTETLIDGADFDQWWYQRDPTHVCFYHERTFEWIGKAFGWRLEKVSKNVFLFQH